MGRAERTSAGSGSRGPAALGLGTVQGPVGLTLWGEQLCTELRSTGLISLLFLIVHSV